MSDTEGISDGDFRKLTAMIGAECGISIGPSKRSMVETRLRKRARLVGMKSLAAYCQYVHSPEGRTKEWPEFVDAITTHKTDFFREPAHFEVLVNRLLPDLAASGAGVRRPLLAWSAACSTGEEPYTLAMVLSRYAESMAPQNYRFRIEATDISHAVVERARSAVYSEEAIRPVPEEFRRKYLLRSKDRHRGLVRIRPEIRAAVECRQLNLMDPTYDFSDPFDVVLCRNVMIYFDRPTQQAVLNRVSRTLRHGGYLLMGHSESLNGLDLPLVQTGPTVYRRSDG
ncbi:MAG TPA: protein-glutamate O-methyltransferase [Bryobacteraceae bacterium]